MERAKKILALVLALSFILSLTSCGGSPGADSVSSPDDTLTIAYIGALTGESSAWGIPEANTLQVLVDQINEQGGIAGRKVVLNIYDNRNDNVETINAAKKAIEVGGADVIVGCTTSGAALALVGACEEYKVPAVATCATNAKVTEDEDGNIREWTFRVCISDPTLGSIMAQYAYEELGLRSIGILREISSDYSVGVSDNFVETFQRLGGKISGMEAYTTGDVDFRAQLAALHQQAPDALFLPMQYKELALAAVQARDLNMDELFIGTDVWVAKDIFDLAGDALTGSYFVCTVDSEDPQLDDFRAMYEEVFGEPCDSTGQNAYFAYDAFQVIKAAVEAADSTNSVAIRDALETVTDVPGLTGPVTIRKDHKVIRPAFIFEVKTDRFAVVESYMVDYGD